MGATRKIYFQVNLRGLFSMISTHCSEVKRNPAETSSARWRMKSPTMLSASSASLFFRTSPILRCTTSSATSGISPTSSRPIVASTSSTKASNLWKLQGAISRATPSPTTNSTFSYFPKWARRFPRNLNLLRFPTTTWPSIGIHFIK